MLPTGIEPTGMSCSVSGGSASLRLSIELPPSSTGIEPTGIEPTGLDCSEGASGFPTTRSKSAPSPMWLRYTVVRVPRTVGTGMRNTSTSPLLAM